MGKDNDFLGDIELETAEVNGALVVRDEHGRWLYADTWIEVPGARDMTLTQRFQPKFVVNKDDEIERVVVDADSIRRFPDWLAWCTEIGTPIYDGEKMTEVIVPFLDWAEHDRIPGEMISPEHHGSEAEQDVARAEREYREAERKFESMTEARAEALRRRSEEMTRQEARAITGLSVGRIQQLIRVAPLDANEREVLELFELSPIKTAADLQNTATEHEVINDDLFLMSVAEELRQRGFLNWEPGLGLAISEAGERALEAVRLEDLEAEPEEI